MWYRFNSVVTQCSRIYFKVYQRKGGKIMQKQKTHESLLTIMYLIQETFEKCRKAEQRYVQLLLG